MSTILDALAKAKREEQTQDAAGTLQMENELAFRQSPRSSAQPPEASDEARQGMRTGVLIGIGAAVLFFISSVLAVSIMLVKIAGDQSNQTMLASHPPASHQRNVPKRPSATPDVQAPKSLAVAPIQNLAERSLLPNVSENESPESISDVPQMAKPAPAITPAPIIVEMDFSAVAAQTPKPSPSPQSTPAPTPKMAPKPARVAQATPTPTPAPTATPKPTPKPQSNIVIGSKRNEGLESIEDLRLSGIIYNKDRPMAMVNGKVVTVGENLQGVEILDIQKDYIRAKFRGQQYTLYY